MSKVICNECETVAHCMKNGCIPKQPANQLDDINVVDIPAQQEPLGKVNELFDEAVIEQCGFDRELLVYTSPPTLSLTQRQARSADTWVGLTDEEVYMNCPNWLSQEQCKVWVQQIEAKLKEKNT